MGTISHQVTCLDGPISATNDLALVLAQTSLGDLSGMWMFLFISDDKDGAKLMIGSDQDNRVNRYEYVHGGSLTSDIGIPVVTYTSANYTKTTSVTVTRAEGDVVRG